MKLLRFKNWLFEDTSIPISKDMPQQPVPGIENDNSDFFNAGIRSKYKSTPKPIELKIDPEKKYKGWSRKRFSENFNCLIAESKQLITNLGYPPIVGKLLYKEYGNLAYLMAKWLRDYKYPNDPKPANWWLQTTSSLRDVSLWDLTDLYANTTDDESYLKALYRKGLSNDKFIGVEYERQELEKQIEIFLKREFFFEDDFIKKVLSGEIKDLNPYKKLSFKEAKEKYEKKSVFKDTVPLKKYKNGYKWINVGMRCQLVGDMMRNCGSAGLMGNDPDRTLLVLFDPENQAHIVVVYSPNEKKISYDQGRASTEPKEKYHEYILDLAHFLNATYDVTRSKSNTLIGKYLISQITNNFEKLPSSSDYYTYFKFYLNNHEYYTDTKYVIKSEDVSKVENALSDKNLNLNTSSGDIIHRIFEFQNRHDLIRFGINFEPIQIFLDKYKQKQQG